MLISKKKVIIIGVAVVAALAIIAYFVIQPGAPAAPGSTGSQAASAGQTRAPLPANVVVPGQGQTIAPGVAAPQVVSPASAHSASQYRSFTISADHNQFTPSTVIVNQGDTVNLLITAVDKKYDFTQPDYGFKETILQGQTKAIQFGATAAGKFTFYCASCGGPTQGPIGYIIIAIPK